MARPKKREGKATDKKCTKTAQKKTKSFEETLWESANKLRGSVEPSEYKHVVLSLIFLKFASDKFEERRRELREEGKDAYLENTAFYRMQNVFYLPVESRWSTIQANAKQDDLAIKVDTALSTIEKNNKQLAGALPDNYFSRLDLDRSKLASLIDTISDIDTIADKSQDIVGRVYEYFLSKFALAEGKGKGEFYTPKSIVNLIAELIEPYKGKIYDPCCGSGGMFVQSIKFVESHQGSTKDISIYGQEGTSTTLKLAKMNLAIRGISGNLGVKADDTFAKDQHPDLKADFIMANPPFNQKDWRASDELTDDPRWAGYEIPPTSNANYAWILQMVSKLSENGMAGFILANGALSDEGQEYQIRRALIENDLIESIILLPRKLFYTTDIGVTLWILNRNKRKRTLNLGNSKRKLRDRDGEVLFLDMRRCGIPFEKKYSKLTDDEASVAIETFHAWRAVDHAERYADIAEYCRSASLGDIRGQDYNLVPSRYIEFNHEDWKIDYEKKLEELQVEIEKIIQIQKEGRKGLISALKELGYEIQN